MKTVLFRLLMICLIFSLAGCFSSGGSGGTNLSPISNAPLTMSAMMGGATQGDAVASDFSNVSAAGTTGAISGNWNLNGVTLAEGSLELRDEHGGLLVTWDLGANDDFHKYNNGFVGGEVTLTDAQAAKLPAHPLLRYASRLRVPVSR